MKIVNEFPPNFTNIEFVFPNLREHKPIFAYGDTIYNPYEIEVGKDLEIHEEVHSKQQGDDPETWWNKYLTDTEFRLSQEIEAYGTQYAFAKKYVNRKLSDWLKDKLAKALSGKLYGELLSFQEAESKIRNYAKNI